MLIFRINPLWCGAVGDGVGAMGAGMGLGQGDPGQSSLGTSDSGGGDFGGFSGGHASIDPSMDNDAIDAAFNALAQSDAQAAENNAIFGQAASDAAEAAKQSAVMSTLKGFLISLFTGMSPLSMVATVVKTTRALNSAKSNMTSVFGQAATDAAFAEAFAGFNAAHASDGGGPGEFTEDQVSNWLQTQAGGGTGDSTGGGTEDGTGTQGTPQVDTSSPDNFWNEFTNQWFNDENNAKLLFQNHVDFLANEADQYNQTTQTATDDQSKLLDRLTKQYAKPININVGGNDMSWVPRGSRNTITELGQVGQTDMTNQINAGKQRMENAQVRSPSIGGLSYLDALQKILADERNKNKLVNDLEIAKTGARIDQQRVDQGEPGFWGTAGSVVKGVDGILDLIGRF